MVTWDGKMVDCPVCHGSGTISEGRSCPTCKGSGKVEQVN